jgi:hypothetical protein
MSYAATFDTLRFIKTLEAKGSNAEQVEGLNMVVVLEQ